MNEPAWEKEREGLNNIVAAAGKLFNIHTQVRLNIFMPLLNHASVCLFFNFRCTSQYPQGATKSDLYGCRSLLQSAVKLVEINFADTEIATTLQHYVAEVNSLYESLQ